MQPSNHAVIFTKNNARVLSFEDIKDLPHLQNILINPELSHVAGIPPHYWVYRDGFILPMNEDEMKARDESIKAYGADNETDLEAIAAKSEELKKEIADKKLKEEQKKDAHDVDHACLHDACKANDYAIRCIHGEVNDALKYIDKRVDTADQSIVGGLSLIADLEKKMHIIFIFLSAVILSATIIIVAMLK